ncbi:ErfK/YbiS/YcfS/YnhG family protein [Methylococcus capsulatus str. Bath]|uniref:ErfK/YbiS/YcfS/YnhG family protein n=1 Tax=Methylococcus capsulatus (strain ATCC 33009 / NCIMB 11132 / Bath) TaxID=243233 RepID=Q60A53_METCA|nr:L,D-transpeptidase [Methylococcus capsulatus]AAU92899.1 ErfK/YbiS/YcfS/YnhG family protein [Methylococcus capsulatus str. Bath]
MNRSANVRSIRSGRSRVLAGILTVAAAALITLEIHARLTPFGMVTYPANGAAMADPRRAVTVEPVGVGSRIAAVELREDNGTVVAAAQELEHFEFTGPLAFGRHYILTTTIERLWSDEKRTEVLEFTTVGIPRLEGPAERTLAPDASLTLVFDQPVGKLEAVGGLKLTVQPEQTRTVFRLEASDYAQGSTYPTQIRWETPGGVPLPPFELRISTPPPVSADVNLRGAENLGTAMPLQITFNEPLAERDKAGRQVRIQTEDGREITGRWGWVGKTRLQFTPLNGWPPSSVIRVSAEPGAFRGVQGGYLEPPLDLSFSTGTDRKIFVYLDTQTMTAVENGQTVRTFKVSTGKPQTPTVTGSFYIYARFPTKTMKSRAKKGEKGHYIVENVPYAQYFYSDYAFHGAWWHNGFGRPASHGCVNMSTQKHNVRWPKAPEDAGWLYQWASLGVPVTVMHSPPSSTSTRIALEEPQRDRPGVRSSPSP